MDPRLREDNDRGEFDFCDTLLRGNDGGGMWWWYGF